MPTSVALTGRNDEVARLNEIPRQSVPGSERVITNVEADSSGG